MHNLINPHGATSIIISAVLYPAAPCPPPPPLPDPCCCRYSCYTSIVIQVRSNHFCCVFYSIFPFFTHAQLIFHTPLPPRTGLPCPALRCPSHCFGAAYFLIIVSPPLAPWQSTPLGSSANCVCKLVKHTHTHTCKHNGERERERCRERGLCPRTLINSLQSENSSVLK